MANIVRDVVISCPPAQVFAVLRDVNRLPEFSEMTVAVRGAPARPVEVGDRFEQVVKLAGKELDTEWEVVEVDEPRLMRVEGTAMANGRATLIERVEPTDDGGSRVTLEVDYDLPFGFLGQALDKLFVEGRNEQEAETILAGLKRLCEG